MPAFSIPKVHTHVDEPRRVEPQISPKAGEAGGLSIYRAHDDEGILVAVIDSGTCAPRISGLLWENI